MTLCPFRVGAKWRVKPHAYMEPNHNVARWAIVGVTGDEYGGMPLLRIRVEMPNGPCCNACIHGRTYIYARGDVREYATPEPETPPPDACDAGAPDCCSEHQVLLPP